MTLIEGNLDVVEDGRLVWSIALILILVEARWETTGCEGREIWDMQRSRLI